MPLFPSLPDNATTKHVFTGNLLALGANFPGDPAWPRFRLHPPRGS
jgi:hypothetical protein